MTSIPSHSSSQSSITATRLNGDTTWLLRFPITTSSSSSSPTSSYNLLIDPWLSPTSQTDYHSLFSSQTRVVQAAYPSLEGVGRALAQEVACRRPEGGGGRGSGEEGGHETPPPQQQQQANTSTSTLPSTSTSAKVHGVDGILLSHPFTDHMHPESLLDEDEGGEVDKSESGSRADGGPIDVFCTPASHAAFERLLHGSTSTRCKNKYKLHLISPAPDDLPTPTSTTTISTSSGPTNVNLYTLPAKESKWTHGPAWSELHSGILLLSHSQQHSSAIIYSPHGTLPTSHPPWLTAHNFPHSRTLITSFDRQTIPVIKWFTGPVALGFREAVLSTGTSTGTGTAGGRQRMLFNPTHVLRTHDERKVARGLIGRVIQRECVDVDMAREMIESQRHFDGDADQEQVVILDLDVGQDVHL